MKKSADEPWIIGGTAIPLGSSRNVRLKISETYFGDDVVIHVRVIRAQRPGPSVFVTAAIHGDEINGTGIVHELLSRGDLKLLRGTLILIPVVNIFGFESNNRYLPDRRDLNRCFPGSPGGSMAGRLAYTLISEIVARCDYGIDLHTAAIQRTNFPNIRGDLTDPGVSFLADAFGGELIVHGKGPEGSFRREACRLGCPTITLEAGEPWKIETEVLDLGVKGVRNVLSHLLMLKNDPVEPQHRARIYKTVWVRAELGGILRFHVKTGETVSKGDPVASNYTIMGRQQSTLRSPINGIILGMATMPTVKPGEPICHIAQTSLKHRI
ncbi:MAG: succinylglutamate desuccinylase/aspartoacylase family protein [Candidatus Methylacidiphilales bacterium]